MTDYHFRVRERGAPGVPQLGASYQEIYCNGTYKYNLSGLGMGYLVGEYEHCVDTVHPNFARRKAAGEIMNTPIYKRKTIWSGSNTSDYTISYSNPNLTCTGTNFLRQLSGQKHLRSMNLSPGLGLSFEWYKELESRQTDVIAGTKAWGGIKSPSIQGTVFAAELGKTLRMLRHPIDNLAQFLKQVKKSKRYKSWSRQQKLDNLGTSLADFIAAEWLRYRYGIMPLLYDIQGIKALLAEPIVSPRLTSRASEKFNSGTLTNTIPYSEGASGYFAGSTVTTRVVNVEVRCGILYEHECILHDRYGYGLDQQLSAIWELIPYSFIVDWFYNLGDYIDAMSPKIGVKVLAQWTTIKVVDAKGAVANAYGTPPSAYYTISGSLSATAQEVNTLYSRQPVCKSGIVDLSKSWDLGRVREQNRILDSIALVTGLLRSR